MEPLFSLRDVLHVALRIKLMNDSEIEAWGALIDELHETHLRELFELFSTENSELPGALKSIDEYLPYLTKAESRRHTWLQKIENEDRGLYPAVSAILQSKRHWTGPQVDAAFRDDESVAQFLSLLTIRDLEQMRKVVDILDAAGEYDDEEGKPTESRDTLVSIIAFLEEDAWVREKREAELLLTHSPLPLSLDAPVLEAASLSAHGIVLRKGRAELTAKEAEAAKLKVLGWAETEPAWFKIHWPAVKTALEIAALTMNISGNLAGLGTIAARIITAGMGERWSKLVSP